MGEDGAEAVQPDVSVADVLVAVAHAAERHLAVVGVHGAQPPEADFAVELGHGRLAALARGDVVAHGEGVAGVEADAEAGMAVAAADDLTDLAEGRADAVPLPGVVLDEQHGLVVRCLQHHAHGGADLLPHGPEARALVAAHVEDGAIHAQLARMMHVAHERVRRALQQGRVRRAQIDEVDGVEEDGQGRARVGLAEGGHGLRAEAGRAPLLRRGDEQLDGLRADGLRPLEHVLRSARRGDVRAHPHGRSLPAARRRVRWREGRTTWTTPSN